MPPEEKAKSDSGNIIAAGVSSPLEIVEELTQEDNELKEELETCVQSLASKNSRHYSKSLAQIKARIQTSTSSMSAVPKPLKLMAPHYETMKGVYEKLRSKELKKQCADIISVLAITSGGGPSFECLDFKLKGHFSRDHIKSWGHEYMRHLSGQVAAKWQDEGTDKNEQLMELIGQLVPALISNKCEIEAIDLLMEADMQMDLIIGHLNQHNYQQVALYMMSSVTYVTCPDNTTLLKTSLKIYKKFKAWPQALRVALKLNERKDIRSIVKACKDPLIRLQLAYMLARQQYSGSTGLPDDLNNILTNNELHERFQNMADILDLTDPKEADDEPDMQHDDFPFIFTSDDTAMQNLSSSLVNGLANAGFGSDSQLVLQNMDPKQKTREAAINLYRNNGSALTAATASIGLVTLWNIDLGLDEVDKYLEIPDDYVKAGALMAIGIMSTGVNHDVDPAMAILSDEITNDGDIRSVAAILGLGLAYAGTDRTDILDGIQPALSSSTFIAIGTTALACGLVSVGSGRKSLIKTLVNTIKTLEDKPQSASIRKYLALAIALCCLGKKEEQLLPDKEMQTISASTRCMVETLADACAHVGSGDVLRIQKLLHICSTGNVELLKDDKELEELKQVAVISLAILSMGDDLGSNMLFRTLGHLLRYGSAKAKQAVPLAIGLMFISNPQLTVLETLSKFSHDEDPIVALNSIMAMGLIGAGSKNARVMAAMKHLSNYYLGDTDFLFMTRLAQGLVQLGKGTMTLNPCHSQNLVLLPEAMAGLLTFVIATLNPENTILGSEPYVLYCLCPAMKPRFLFTLDENSNPVSVSARVGKAVDTVTQVGKPRTITGFNTNNTPVIIGPEERVELANEEYTPMTPILEDVVVLQKNTD